MSQFSAALEPASSPSSLFRAYGLNWHSDVPLALFPHTVDQASQIDVRVLLHESDEAVPDRSILIGSEKIIITGDGGLRYREGDIATMDVSGTKQISIYPGREWEGVLPHSFYSTVVGAFLALRGGLTIHGSAVEIDGKAVVLCGRSGAGKSTSIAALIANGARLISDDLTVIEPLSANMSPSVFTGRRCIRLFAGTAAALRRVIATEISTAGGTKELIAAPQADVVRALPLAGFILLGSDEGTNSGPLTLDLKELLFKPNVFPHLPGHILRDLALRAVLAKAAFASAPAVRYSLETDLKELGRSTLACWQRSSLSVQFT